MLELKRVWQGSSSSLFPHSRTCHESHTWAQARVARTWHAPTARAGRHDLNMLWHLPGMHLQLGANQKSQSQTFATNDIRIT
eukprot:scaffold241803_cov19-Tisochrysis_lutea.AAC.2